jgi:hypothetical protein
MGWSLGSQLVVCHAAFLEYSNAFPQARCTERKFVGNFLLGGDLEQQNLNDNSSSLTAPPHF